jgi:hypothetical protein
MKIRPVGADLLHTDERTDRQADRHDDRFAVTRTRLKFVLLVFMSYPHP